MVTVILDLFSIGIVSDRVPLNIDQRVNGQDQDIAVKVIDEEVEKAFKIRRWIEFVAPDIKDTLALIIGFSLTVLAISIWIFPGYDTYGAYLLLSSTYTYFGLFYISYWALRWGYYSVYQLSENVDKRKQRYLELLSKGELWDGYFELDFKIFGFWFSILVILIPVIFGSSWDTF